LGLQKSNQKEKEVDPFAQLGSPGKKSKVGILLSQSKSGHPSSQSKSQTLRPNHTVLRRAALSGPEGRQPVLDGGLFSLSPPQTLLTNF